MSMRRKSNSVWDAEGNPISISLKPMSTRTLNMRSFLLVSMGSMSAWLPSRRSTLHQMGALVITRLGHCRSGSLMGSKAWYFSVGITDMMVPVWVRTRVSGR